MKKLFIIMLVFLLFSCGGPRKPKCVNIKTIPVKNGIVVGDGKYYLLIQSIDDLKSYEVSRDVYMYVYIGDTINKDTTENKTIKFIKR